MQNACPDFGTPIPELETDIPVSFLRNNSQTTGKEQITNESRALARAMHKLSAAVTKLNIMNTTTHTRHEESTYALLIRSQKEERSLPEVAVYILLILAAAFSVWQSAEQRFQVPTFGLLPTAPIAQTAQPTNPPA